jgi:ribosomal protein L16/L10AE
MARMRGYLLLLVRKRRRQALARMKVLLRRKRLRKRHLQTLARMKRRSRREDWIAFGRCRYALQALEPAAIPAETIAEARRELIAFMPYGGIWILPDEHVSINTTKSGRRLQYNIESDDILYHVSITTTKSGRRLRYNIEPGAILYQVWGVPETIAIIALTQAASKVTLNTMPIKTQIIYMKLLNYL